MLIDLGASMGGVEAYLEALAKILTPQADVYAICVLGELAERLSACGVHVTRIPLFARLRLLRFAAAVCAMVSLLLRHRIDVVQINGFLESILLLPARLLGRETVYTRHGPFETELYSWYRQPGKYLPRMASRYGARLASRLVCVSETVGHLYAPLFAPGRVAVIPNWVSSLPALRTERARDNKDARPLRILCAGRLERYKGVHLLIEAVREVDHVELTVIGEGAYRGELERLAAGANVRFAGFQRDTASFYREADIFVMPSLGPEGLPMVALEAMSHSLPCIFSDLPVHREITGDGLAAALFHSGDAADLLAKLQALVANPAERARLARNAYRMVEEKYHEPVARAAYLQVFAVGGA